MEKRPLFRGYWAQDALPEDIGDADVYVPSNPVYPEQVPEQYSAGWFVSPDNDQVKQPHQWNNAWLQAVDYMLWNWYTNNFGWIPEVSYPAKAVAVEAGLRYVAKTANQNARPSTSPAIWEHAAFSTKAEAEQALAQLQQKYNSHESSKLNPHGENYDSVGGYSKATIDNKVKQQQDNVDAHEADKNNPHGLTTAQVGTLPVAGGTFTGQVSVLRMVFGAGGEIRRLSSGFEMYVPSNGGGRFGIDTTKRDAQLNGESMLTDRNYEAMRQRNAWKFAVPNADIELRLVSGLHGYSSAFNGVDYNSTATISYTDKSGRAQVAAIGEPGFGKLGLELRPGAGQTLVSPVPAGSVRGTVFGVLDGVPVVGIGPLSQSNLLEYFPAGTALRGLRVWFYELTPYQISALGVTP